MPCSFLFRSYSCPSRESIVSKKERKKKRAHATVLPFCTCAHPLLSFCVYYYPLGVQHARLCFMLHVLSPMRWSLVSIYPFSIARSPCPCPSPSPCTPHRTT